MEKFNISAYEKQIKKQSLILCVVLAALLITMLVTQTLLQYLNKDMDTLINVSGRQRMLSQKLAFQKVNSHPKINQTLKLFMDSQEYLSQNSTVEINDFYKKSLNTLFTDYILMIKAPIKSNAELIITSERILTQLDKAVHLFEAQSNQNEKIIFICNIFFLNLILMAIIFLYFNLLARQRKKIIKSLNQYTKQKEISTKATQTKTIFLANISHELKTPLNAIENISSLLKDTKLDIKQAQYLEMIAKSSKKLSHIIESIFKLTDTPRSNEEQSKYQVIMLNDFLLNLIEQSQTRAKKKGLSLRLESEDSASHRIYSNLELLSELLSHILDNAIKFTDEGEIVIHTEITKIYTKITITDTGIGISQKNLEHIFESFTQVENTYTKTKNGAGLGLSIAKEISQKINTTLEVDSKLKQGTSFTVKIPSHPLAFYNSQQKINMKKTLIVEDNVINQVIIKNILKSCNIDFDIANNGVEAVDLFNSNEYTLILMDISMPVMDGFETTRIIRQKDQNIPIFCISANDSNQDKDEAKASGMNEFFSKPLEKDLLIKTLNRYFLI